MSRQYYLMAQLPDISVNSDKSDLPITEEYFNDLCHRFLDEKELTMLDELSLELLVLVQETSSSGIKAINNFLLFFIIDKACTFII